MGFLTFWKRKPPVVVTDSRLIPPTEPTTEVGRRGTEESQLRAMYERMYPSYDLYSTIKEIRRMDREDGHVKKIHNRTSKALTKGGLILENPTNDKALEAAWTRLRRACHLDDRLKLISDARGLLVDGALPLQWVLDKSGKQVLRCVRMPAETIRPIVDVSGQFEDPKAAYAQYSFTDGCDIASFAQWQLYVTRLDPDNYDDMGALGRPLLDASRKRWRQVMMTQEDMVIRRRTRAALRTAHVMKGASNATLAEYKRQVESDEASGMGNNYYMNTDGGVQAVQGDANLEQVADVAMLLDSWFAGTPMPKAMLGYVDGLSRDVLMDMKEEFYDELDTLQDSLASGYEHGMRLQLLLSGINPDAVPWAIRYGERLTETLGQRTDRSLKLRALGVSNHTVWTTAGLDPNAELDRLAEERESLDPYPLNDDPLGDIADPSQRITITPGNAKKNASATDITNE